MTPRKSRSAHPEGAVVHVGEAVGTPAKGRVRAAEPAPAPGLIGGHPALDLINSVAWRLDEARWTDRLATFEDLVARCTQAGIIEMPSGAVLPSPSPEAAAHILGRVRMLRETAYLALCDHLAGRPMGAEVLSSLQESLSSVLRVGTLSATLPLRLGISPASASQVPDAVAASLFDLFVLQDLTRLRECQGDGCGWLYLDRSKNRSRRWCSSADCGNRYRVHQFATRARDASGALRSSSVPASARSGRPAVIVPLQQSTQRLRP